MINFKSSSILLFSVLFSMQVFAAQATVDSWFDAAERDNLSVMRMLSRKVQVDTTNQNSETALIVAANAGASRAVAYLLSLKANANLKDKSGQTAIFYAVSNGYSKIAKMLVRRSDLKILYQDQENLSFEAARTGHARILFGLVQHSPELLSQENLNGETAIFAAVRSGHFTLARQMIAKGAKIDIKNKKGQSLLNVALEAGVPVDHPLYKQLQTNP